MPDFFAEPAVCNTGPLLALYRVRQLGLLSKLLPEIIVPCEVLDEIVLAPYADARALARELFRFSVADGHVPRDPMLAAELDVGETAVIATAHLRGLRNLIIDERKGRRIAGVAYGFRVKGTAGILPAAKQRGLIAEIRPLLEAMRSAGYYLSTGLIDEWRKSCCVRLPTR